MRVARLFLFFSTLWLSTTYALNDKPRVERLSPCDDYYAEFSAFRLADGVKKGSEGLHRTASGDDIVRAKKARKNRKTQKNPRKRSKHGVEHRTVRLSNRAGLTYDTNYEKWIIVTKEYYKEEGEDKIRFHYFRNETDLKNGREIKNKKELERFASIAPPPIWEDIRISPLKNNHVLAVGTDSEGRRQPRQHPKWKRIGAADKFAGIVEYAEALPLMRKRVLEDLKSEDASGKVRGLTKERVLAGMFYLLDLGAFRPGSKAGLKQTGNVGLTTTTPDHFYPGYKNTLVSFTAKLGVDQDFYIRNDPEIAALLKELKRLHEENAAQRSNTDRGFYRVLSNTPMFQYVDKNGKLRNLTENHLKEYIRDAMGDHHTPKQSRTWRATVVAAAELSKMPPTKDPEKKRDNYNKAVVMAAKQLGNKPSESDHSYIHPFVWEVYERKDGAFKKAFGKKGRPPTRNIHGIDGEEVGTLRLLEAEYRRRSR